MESSVTGSAESRELPSGTVTFLFTDVEGSTRLWAADTEAMSASLGVHDTILRDAIEAHGGYVFTTAGDSFAAAFHRPSDALRAASAAQAGLAEVAWPGPVLRVRMGVHLGETEERGGDYFGSVVNLTARTEAAGHGGQVLITEAVRSAASVEEVLDLGVHQLRDVAEPLRLFQFGPGAFPALRVAAPGSSNLPVRPTRLIGREDEVLAVRGLLATSRLVTITAVGGSGKTRVALAVGEAELAHRADGVWFVDLSAVSADADLVGAIAVATGLSLNAGDPDQQLVDFLADKAALVILDNCEHLIDACAVFADCFLAAAGSTTILATSREALDVDGERTFVLSPLPADTVDSPAVRLFVERATAVDPRFALDDDNAASVAAICGRLDGMPLAIELAAARVVALSPAELLAGLDDRFRLLSGGRRRQRQRTLEATLDWSYDLLDAEEQRALRALGVFVDGFDLTAFTAVAAVDGATALDLLEALVAKSLVERADRDDQVRFRLLETVKAYAEDRLVDAGEAAMVRDRHLDHFHALVPFQGSVVGALPLALRLRADRQNLTAAVEWAAATGQWLRAAELLLGGSGVVPLDFAWLEALPLVDRAIEHCAPLDTELTERLRVVRLSLLIQIADVRLFGEVLEVSASPMGGARARAKSFLAFLAATTAYDPAAVVADVEADIETLDPSDRLVNDARIMVALSQGVAAAAADDLEAALAFCRQGTSLSTDQTDANLHSVTVASLAVCEVLQGDPSTGLELITGLGGSGLPDARGDDIRALAALAVGDLELAAEHVRAHAAHAASGRWMLEWSNSLILLTALSLAEGDRDGARRLLTPVKSARSPAGNILASHLALELGLGEHHRALKQQLREDEAAYRSEGMIALNAERARRGWV